TLEIDRYFVSGDVGYGILDVASLIADRDRENLLVMVREVEAECDAVEVKM
ncbi:hypothetical protein Tco_1160082, partial [Tanacetum coccineum]